MPLAVALLAFLVFALSEALHDSRAMSGSTTIQTAGFYKPTSTTPIPFTLPVLQAATTAQSDAVGPITMTSLRGKPVVLNIWSSSCTICKAETPTLETMARRAGHAVRFVGIDTLNPKDTGVAFLHRYGVTYLQLFDPNEVVGSGYGIPGFPVTVFVSGDGKVVGEYLGALSTRTLAHYLTTLLGVRLAPS